MDSISKELKIFSKYQSYDEIPNAVRAWITIKSKRRGFNPKMVHAGIKASYARMQKGKKVYYSDGEKTVQKTQKTRIITRGDTAIIVSPDMIEIISG